MQFLLFIHLWAARQLLTCSTNHHLRWLASPLRLLLGLWNARRMLYDLCRPQQNMLLRLRQLPKFSKSYAIASQATLAIGILLLTLRRTNVARLLVAKSWLSLLLPMKRWLYFYFFLKHCAIKGRITLARQLVLTAFFADCLSISSRPSIIRKQMTLRIAIRSATR